LQTEAGQIATVRYEDDFTEARLIFQALPLGAKERGPLRLKLMHYLLDPVIALQPAALRREVRDLENDDVYDVIFESFRDALALVDPAELWSQPIRISPEEQRLLRPAAELVVAIFSPRGGDQQVTLGLVVLATLAPDVREYSDRLDQVLRWTQEASQVEERGMRRATDATDALESALGDWPAPR
jgi:hypothetical protein